MADNYSAKKISELLQATKITDKDYFVINEFSYETGYALTKKVLAKALADYINARLSAGGGAIENLNLSDLAHCDVPKMLDKTMTLSHPYQTEMSAQSLALSALDDLKLGDLAYSDESDLKLDKYVQKLDATASFTAGSRQYINAIAQRDGVITNVSLGNLDDKLPVDVSLDKVSSNPVQNKAIAEALDSKVDKDSAYVDDTAVDGFYVDQVAQNDGKINVHRTALPTYQIDSSIDSHSSNPVQNKVIAARFTDVEASLKSDAESKYVRKDASSSSFTAGNNQYICKIQQTEGLITDVQYKTLPTQATIDAEMSTTSTNAVQNKVITAAINSLATPQQQLLDLLDTVYPIGSIYLTTGNVCPLQLLGIGTWSIVGTGRCLWGGNGYNGAKTVNAGLPNITGSAANLFYYGNASTSGAISRSTHAQSSFTPDGAADYTEMYGTYVLDAKNSNKIYGNSTTVQPPAYIVNVFRRIETKQ